MNQEEHHKKQTFREEYLELLRKFEIPFEDKYLFEFYDELEYILHKSVLMKRRITTLHKDVPTGLAFNGVIFLP